MLNLFNLKPFFSMNEIKDDPNDELASIQPFDGSTEARVETDIEPGALGRIYCGGIYWRACCDSKTTILAGSKVQVLGRQRDSLTLFVASTR